MHAFGKTHMYWITHQKCILILLLWVWGSIVLTAREAPAQASPIPNSPSIELSEVDRFSLPPGFFPTGAVLHAAWQVVVLWSPESIFYRGPEGTKHIPVGTSVRGLRLISASEAETIGDREHLQISFAPTSVVRKDTTNRIASPMSAAWTGDEWVGWRPYGDSVIEAFSTRASGVIRFTTRSRFFYIRPAPRGSVVLTAEDKPFENIRITIRSGVQERFDTIPDALLGDDGIWKALPTVAIPQGYIQTITDLRSNDRLVLRFDSFGNLMASSRVPSPMGFIASDGSLVAAVYDSGGERHVVLLSVLEKEETQ